VDGTSLPIYEPMCNAFNAPSVVSHKKHHAYRWFAVVLPNGRPVYVSKLFAGKTKDDTAWNESDINAVLNEFFALVRNVPELQNTHVELCVMADKGYPTIEMPRGWKLVVTKSAEYSGTGQSRHQTPARADYLVYSAMIAPFRSVVERFFALVKRWRRLASGQAFVRQGEPLLYPLIIVRCAVVVDMLAANPARLTRSVAHPNAARDDDAEDSDDASGSNEDELLRY
jgi:hypothetical protein